MMRVLRPGSRLEQMFCHNIRAVESTRPPCHGIASFFAPGVQLHREFDPVMVGGCSVSAGHHPDVRS